jgi:hypothetical protein
LLNGSGSPSPREFRARDPPGRDATGRVTQAACTVVGWAMQAARTVVGWAAQAARAVVG